MATTKEPKAPEPNITIAEVKAPGIIHVASELKEAGDMVVEEFKPSADDVARLAKSKSTVLPDQAQPATEPEAPSVLIGPSKAKQTFAEMERGAALVKQKTEERNRRLAAG